MRPLRSAFIFFFITASLVTVDQITVHLFIEEECKYLIAHIFTVLFLSFIASIISFFILNWAKKIESMKIKSDLQNAKAVGVLEAAHKLQDICGNFMNSLLIIEIETEEKGVISLDTLEDIKKNMKVVSEKIANLADIQ